jgi:microcystin-dependent protein
MSEPFLSEIRIMSFNFPPKGWALCNGQLLPINQNQALFSLLGTTYGGDGRVNFGLPDLQGRTPMHMGNSHVLGERGGEQTHVLTTPEIPTHTHTASGTNANGGTAVPGGETLGSFANAYTQPAQLTSLLPASLASVGGNQAHPNMQPFLTLNFSIALQGIFPSQN